MSDKLKELVAKVPHSTYKPQIPHAPKQVQDRMPEYCKLDCVRCELEQALAAGVERRFSGSQIEQILKDVVAYWHARPSESLSDGIRETLTCVTFAAPQPSAPVGEPLREALQLLYDETADYIRINNLGDVHHNRSMQMARAALANPERGGGK